jgi:pimeloyl-ACP methyl ester carboxylesterase
MFFWLVLAAVCAPAAWAAQAQTPSPRDRAEAIRILADMRRVVADDGIERLEKVRIGGIDQWVSIRGNDPRNPVLLMLHGGPGWVSMPTSWYFQRGWKEYFTVVQWDQRGAGKTYASNDADAVAPTMRREQMVADALEMVAWLRHTFGKEKIFVLGHSWGSYLGLGVAHRRPDWLHAYIGMGQITNAPESERRGWAWALQQAREDRNATAIADLEALAPYAQGSRPVPLDHLFKQRHWLNHYGGMVHNRRNGDAEAAAFALSPEYSDLDMVAVWKGNAFSMQHLLADALTVDMSTIGRLDTPVFLFLGRHDHNVSSALAAEWLAGLAAPHKQVVWFEQSAHEVMNEEPGKMLVTLVGQVRPLAARVGDVAP